MIRATVHRADGTSEEVPFEVSEGFDPEDLFPNHVDVLHKYRAGGWQLEDEVHQHGNGHPGYRIA